MNEKRIIWTVVMATATMTGYRAIKHGDDPIPSWAGIGVVGAGLLFLAEVAPRLASGFSVMMGTAYALQWELDKKDEK